MDKITTGHTHTALTHTHTIFYSKVLLFQNSLEDTTPDFQIKDNLQARALLKTKGTNQHIIQLVQGPDTHSQSCHPYLQRGLYVCVYVI